MNGSMMATARSEVETAVECFRRGAVNHVIKPVEPPVLLAKIRETLVDCGTVPAASEGGT